MLVSSSAEDVVFGERVDDRIRNKIIEAKDDEAEIKKLEKTLMYTPKKWPYTKQDAEKKGAEKEEKSDDEKLAEEAAGKDKARWTHLVNIPYETVGMEEEDVEFFSRVALDFRAKTCINFFPAKLEDIPEEKQVVRFAMEDIGCDEIIGMKDVSRERPQMQGMHKDCIERETPQFTSHYLMHILGFDNEHQRSDNEDWIAVKKSDDIAIIEAPQRFGREGHNNTLKDHVSKANGDFDPLSIMMWDSSYVGPLLQKIEIDGKEVAHMGTDQKFTVTDNDKEKIRNYYECVEIEVPEEDPPFVPEPKDPKDPKEPVPEEKKVPEEPKIDCIYHIKENGSQDVANKCFINTAEVNVWPQENKQIKVTIEYNIEEGGLGEMVAGKPEASRLLSFEEDLVTFRKDIEEDMFINEDLLENSGCVKANIATASGGSINTALDVDCGQDKRVLMSECGKGVKSDYFFAAEEGYFLSKGSETYMKVEAVYVDCAKEETKRGISLNAGGVDGSVDFNAGSKTSSFLFAMMALFA